MATEKEQERNRARVMAKMHEIANEREERGLGALADSEVFKLALAEIFPDAPKA